MSNQNPLDPNKLSLGGFGDTKTGSSTVAASPDFSDLTAGSSTVAGGGAQGSYTVVAGDSLSKIAKKHYGDASRWQQIFEANRDQIENPDKIYPGQTLRLP